MAKQDRIVPARRQRQPADDSLLLRSAESLGRVIGTLQRQLDGATKRLQSNAAPAAEDDSARPVRSRRGSGDNDAATKTKTTPRRRAAAGNTPHASAHTVTRVRKPTAKSADGRKMSVERRPRKAAGTATAAKRPAAVARKTKRLPGAARTGKRAGRG